MAGLNGDYGAVGAAALAGSKKINPLMIILAGPWLLFYPFMATHAVKTKNPYKKKTAKWLLIVIWLTFAIMYMTIVSSGIKRFNNASNAGSSTMSTQENVHLETLGFDAEANKTYRVIITPIAIAGERLGTFFIYRKGEEYGIDDIILAEYGTAVIGLEMVRAMDEENAAELRRKQGVRSAISTLSTSEVDAVRYIFEEMTGKEGILVASKIADRVGITRSVIVNALRKLESAGVIESRSSGMKGTYIKIKNDLIREEIERSAEE